MGIDALHWKKKKKSIYILFVCTVKYILDVDGTCITSLVSENC